MGDEGAAVKASGYPEVGLVGRGGGGSNGGGGGCLGQNQYCGHPSQPPLATPKVAARQEERDRLGGGTGEGGVTADAA